ncbi:TIGR03663 family protein [Halopelagius inordinatus]|uniref:TIGR03663 family protein n=1 Tax=Halopelagius inordinatus TaxID=553467 RepID=A0A1I2NHE8_9EURY|nr:flippase activity-associated protein Agl23 [Halopelagius inordinatus]SFG03043.1 TIGR03663 family protein [Halopelagius inordinatus]
MSSDEASSPSAPASSSATVEESASTPTEAKAGAERRHRYDHSRVLLGVLAITAAALALRLVALGGRIMHWDEGRVGYWILRYHDSGYHVYRPIVHGPFLPVVNDWLFAVVPPSDFAVRLPVAVVGGLLPLAAWLFRERLTRTEVVALAAVLALNPLLVYYSRFMRNDVLVAAFSLFALGFAVRGFDTGRLRYAFPAAASMGLAFTTKENALIYVLCFGGAAFLLLDHRLLAATARGESTRDVVGGRWPRALAARLRGHGRTTRRGLLRVGGTFAASLLVFLAVVFFFYAPRPDLWQVLGTPSTLPTVVEAGTVGAAEKFTDTWASGGHQDHAYLPFLHDFLETMVYGAPGVIAFALVGTVIDRYGFRGGRYREFVAFATYWGFVSILGYPIATDIEAPWAVVHAVVPLAVPAAVGLAFVFESGRDALSSDDAVGVGLAALVVLASLGGAVAANATYFNSASEEDKQVLQWAQPENDLKPTMETVGAVAQSNEGTDVLFYGTTAPGSDEEMFYVENESSLRTPPPGGPAWHDRLPLPWYLELHGANVTSSSPSLSPAEALADAPPVVIAKDYSRDEVEPELDGYEAYEHEFRLWNDGVVVFIDREALDAVNGPDTNADAPESLRSADGPSGTPASASVAV